MPNDDDGRFSRRHGRPVSEYFGRLAHTYGDGEYYAARRAAVIEAIRGEIMGARRGLDLGCGNGHYLEEFRTIAPGAFCGADFSEEMLREAAARSRAPLVRADASILPFRNRAFDLIFASHVLPFVSDFRAAVKDIARCLAPGGVLVATAGGGLRAALQDAIGEREWRTISALVIGARERSGGDVEEFHREAFLSAGLKLEVRTASFQISWNGVEEWVRLRWFPFATEAERTEAARVFSSIRASHAPNSIHLHEGLVLGRRPIS